MSQASPMELYRRSCFATAKSSPMWCSLPGGEEAECVECGYETSWLSPDSRVCCPWCWDWFSGDQTVVPISPPPEWASALVERRIALFCCSQRRVPELRWGWIANGKKLCKLGLSAACVVCKKHIRWVDPKDYAHMLPARPPIDLGLGEVHDARVRSDVDNYVPPPREADPYKRARDRVVATHGVYETVLMGTAARLYLDDRGVICCTLPWGVIPTAHVNAIRESSVELKCAMIEDVHWQLSAVAISPHVFHVHPQDRQRRALHAAYLRGAYVPKQPYPPGFLVQEVVDMERDALGLSLTERAYAGWEGDHRFSDAVAVRTTSLGLF